MSSEVLLNSNNMLSKAKKETEKELRRFLDNSNIVIYKIKYATIRWSIDAVELNTNNWHVY